MEQGAEVGPAVVGTWWEGQLRVVVVVVLLTEHLAVGLEAGPAVVVDCGVDQELLRVVVVVVVVHAHAALLTEHLAVGLEAGPAVVVDCGVGQELMEVAVCSVTGTSLKVEDQGAKLPMMRTRLKVEEGGAQMMQFGIFAVTLTLLARPHWLLQT